MSDTEDLIKEADRIAESLINKRARRIEGIYYSTWAIYFLMVGLGYSVLYSLGLSVNGILVLLINFLPVFIPIYITTKVFYGIKRDFVVLKHGKLDRKTQLRNLLLIGVFYTAFLFSIGYSVLFTNRIVGLLSLAVFIFTIIYLQYRNLFSPYKLTEPRYYDVIALFSLSFFPLTSVIPEVTGVISVVVTITWVFAGVMSLLEVIDIE